MDLADTRNNTFSKEKIIIIVMIISVLIGIYLALNSWLKIEDDEWVTNRQERRMSQTEKLATNADRQYFITRNMLPLLRLICESQEFDINFIREEYLERYGLDVSIYKFENSKLTETAPEQAANKWLMRNLFPALIETDIKKIEAKSKELDKKIEYTFGYGKNLVSIRNNPEIVINTVIQGKESFAVWANRSEKGVIILSNGLPDNDKILKEIKGQELKLDNPVMSGRINNKDSSNEHKEVRTVYRMFFYNSINHGIYNDKDWYFVRTKNNEVFFAAYKLSNSVYFRGLVFLKILFVIVILLTVFVICKYSRDSILSLKKFVTLIFLASSILPLTITGTTSLESVATLTNIHKNELRSAMEEAIGNTIQKFGNYLNNCSSSLLELTEPPNGAFSDIESIKTVEQRIIKQFPEARITVRNAASAELYSNSTSYSSGQETLFKSLSNRYLEKYMPVRLKELEYSGNPFSDALVKKEALGFSAICNYPNQLQYIKNGGFPLFIFTRVYPPEVGNVAIMAVEPKLRNVMKKYSQSLDQHSLIANQQIINLAAYNPLKFRWSIPPKFSETQLFEQAKAAYVLNKPIFRRINQKGNQIYSLCIPNSDYEDICYIGSLSSDSFQRELRKLKLYIFTGAIVAAILLVFIIGWLMRELIAPLGNLELGIKALSEHKYETKLTVPQGNDELATLFKEFNFMMGENYDMQLAKNVQEGLITSKFPEIEGFYINGYSMPAGDLGGDCLTSFLLPDGKLLFLIGDLTGHSIGSALMMSFVRSVTFNWSQNPEEKPASLADSIDQMLRDNHMEHMFMGIICGILDPQNGKLKFITRGHIYPLFLRNDGSVEWLGEPALPLGIGKRKLSVEQETVLLPEERLLCISDGFIEIHKENGMTIDYDVVEKWAKHTIDGDNSTWLQRIEGKYREWVSMNKAEQTDDVTLFTIISEKKTRGEENGK